MGKIDMKPFIGVKRINASMPMTKKEYCEIRGWDVPANEDADEMVVLVEYEPEEGKEGNVPGFEGYVSMSPMSVFKTAYTEMFSGSHNMSEIPEKLAPFQQRMVNEITELTVKIIALDGFFKSEMFAKLPEEEKVLMNQQFMAMVAYSNVLNCRIDNFEQVDFKPEVITGNFGDAIGWLKAGHCIARHGWNGTGMFVCKQVPSEIKSDIVPKMQSLPQSAKELFQDTFDDEDRQIDAIYYNDQMIIASTENSNLINSWVPSSSDVFAEDWFIVK